MYLAEQFVITCKNCGNKLTISADQNNDLQVYPCKSCIDDASDTNNDKYGLLDFPF